MVGLGVGLEFDGVSRLHQRFATDLGADPMAADHVADRAVAVKMPNWPSVSSPLSRTEKVSAKSFACSPSPLARK
jgi:hypothetical protein